MREFFIFNCEAITVNLRKKRKALDELLVAWVLFMYSHITFSYIIHNCRNLLTSFHPSLQDSQGAPWHRDKWSEDKVPLQRNAQDTKNMTVQHLHLLRTHLVNCNQEKQGSKTAHKTSAQHGARRFHWAITRKGPKQNYTCKENIGKKGSKLSQAGAVQSLDGAYVTETCHNGTCHQRLKYMWKQQQHWERLEPHKDIE